MTSRLARVALLLAQWLGVVTLALLTSGCSPYVPDPLAPSPVMPIVEPTPPPVVPVQPLTVSLSIGRSNPTVGDPISFVATTGTTISQADWAFGNGATDRTTRGSTGYAYPTAGTFQVQVTVTASDGRTAADATTVTVARRPSPTTPTNPTPPPPSDFLVRLTCTASPVGRPTPCNVQTSYHDQPIPSGDVTSVTWDYGNGARFITTLPTASYPYPQSGTYRVFADVTAMTSEGAKVASANLEVIIE